MTAPPAGISVLPVAGLPEFSPGDDLAGAVAAAAPWLSDDDVLVVTSKVVSKVEGNLVSVPPGTDRESARQQAITAETVRVVARRGPLSIVETRHGWVVAAAGIDASNVASDTLVLLPEDADASARRLRDRLHELLGVTVAVVVSDTFGRPWRDGVTDVAIGAAGLPALVDHRGAVDTHGNRLETTQVAVVDELAAAGDLVKGKLGGLPVAVVRGLRFRPPAPDQGTRPLVRLGAGDLFPTGTRDLVGSRTSAPSIAHRDGALLAVTEAFRTAVAALPEFPVVFRYGSEEGDDGDVVDVHLADPITPVTSLALGAVVGAALVQLQAEGWATRWEPAATFGGASLAGRLWLGRTPT
ncbi:MULTISPECIES: coenzyme F420-0:L-glutamate ligase [unclassified Modestobacter]|uniref:coenzyme F420-0:L-glutamate ligase n=1 Tax=unclassified Modestobacter TaxID=2643866 RepID=UPI0022AB33B0|nr:MULTISPECIES: coenzyme F420-0:L-glutamate ligase [unclassified Modestobacter]MCZ2823798.1 coenzyme F420-0:L-glutamate ligase [Modestobacter sp. VKM Ac-2981]MCZ2852043.1 coenzyme F420-0:L-glutamate ligase [Modestobacter sp. VKM Ac-2982]